MIVEGGAELRDGLRQGEAHLLGPRKEEIPWKTCRCRLPPAAKSNLERKIGGDLQRRRHIPPKGSPHGGFEAPLGTTKHQAPSPRTLLENETPGTLSRERLLRIRHRLPRGGRPAQARKSKRALPGRELSAGHAVRERVIRFRKVDLMIVEGSAELRDA
jgi:hypothetical protein